MTEVFATVLSVHDGLAKGLFEAVELPAGDRFEVLTQTRFGPRCCPDMVVRSLAPGGRRVSQLWCEHKTVSGFHADQRETYAAALSREPGDHGALLTITGDGSTDDGAGPWRHLTWQQVGELADAVGRSWGDRAWRRRALDPEAPARERLLHEFLWYLEKERHAVISPLDRDDVRTFGRFAETFAGLTALFGRAIDHLSPLPAIEQAADSDGMWVVFAPPTGTWLERLAAVECTPELTLSADDSWLPQSTGEPAFGVGCSFPEAMHGVLSVKAEWVSALEAEGFTLAADHDYVYCYRTTALATLVDAADTLDGQARELATWARDGIGTLARLDPGELDVPTPRRDQPRAA